MPDVNQSRIQSMLSELKQLGVIKEIDIPEITSGTFCKVVHKTLPTDVVELEGVPVSVGDTVNKVTKVTEKGKLCVVVL